MGADTADGGVCRAHPVFPAIPRGAPAGGKLRQMEVRMDSMKAVLPDMINARVEDLYNAQLSDEEVLAHMADMQRKAEHLLELASEENRESAALVMQELIELSHRVRRSYVDMSYRQGLRDGFQLQTDL
jgi:hypothetical protein